MTNREFADTVRAVRAASWPAASRPVTGRIALLDALRVECPRFAIWAVGGVTVPVYDSSSAEQIRWIMEDSAARLIFVELESHAVTAREGIVG